MHWFYEKNLISHGKLMPSTGCVLQPSFLLKLIQKVQISNFNLATGTLLVIRYIISTLLVTDFHSMWWWLKRTI